MAHIDLSSKRAKLALRFFTYGVMTFATIVLTMLAIFYAMGYRFNQQDLTFEQGGLVQIRSFPEGARVIIDGKPQGFTTPGRASLSAGTHTIEMQVAGYRSWQKTVDLAPGQVLWLNYARLISDTITTLGQAEFNNVTSALASPDRKWMVVLEQTNQPQIKLIDFNDEKKPVVSDLSIPEAQLTKKDGGFGTFAVKEWDLGSRYILMEHTVGDTREFIRLDRQRASAATNISRVFSLNIAEAHFTAGNPNLLYAKTDTVLRSLDLGSNIASAALVTDIEQFMLYGNDTVAFVATRNATEGDGSTKRRIAGLYRGGKETIVREFRPDANVRVAYAEYVRDAYFAFDSGDGNVQILRDPTSKDSSRVGSIPFGGPISWMKFSSNGRMLAVGHGNKVGVYDLELARAHAWDVSGAEVTRPLAWLDDYYLWTDAGGSLRIVEFDNTNGREITAVTPGLTASISPDGNYLYSFAKNNTTGTYQLQSSQLVK